MDFVIEKLIARKRNKSDYLFYAGVVLGALAILFAALLISFTRGIWLFLAAGAFYLAYTLFKSRNIEYEYIVTNSDFEIDKIIAKQKRKQVFSADCKSFELVARYQGEQYRQASKEADNIINAVGSMESDNIYFILLNYKNKKTMVLFEPDERILDSFRKYISRQVFTKA